MASAVSDRKVDGCSAQYASKVLAMGISNTIENEQEYADEIELELIDHGWDVRREVHPDQSMWRRADMVISKEDMPTVGLELKVNLPSHSSDPVWTASNALMQVLMYRSMEYTQEEVDLWGVCFYNCDRYSNTGRMLSTLFNRFGIGYLTNGVLWFKGEDMHHTVPLFNETSPYYLSDLKKVHGFVNSRLAEVDDKLYDGFERLENPYEDRSHQSFVD